MRIYLFFGQYPGKHFHLARTIQEPNDDLHLDLTELIKDDYTLRKSTLGLF